MFSIFTCAESTAMSPHEYFEKIQKFADAYEPGGLISGTDSSELPLNRLIVKTDSNEPLEETYGAIATLDGYNNLHILQYETSAQTENACENLSNSDVEYVEYDFRISFITDTERYCYCPKNTDNYPSCICSENSEEHGVCTCETHDAPENYLSWNSAAAKVVEAFEYIETNNINCSDVRVAVLDTGIYMDHEYFSKKGESRLCLDENYILKKGDTEYPSDEDTNFHGTHVAGIIYDNTMSNVDIYSYRIIPPEDTIITYSELCGAIDAAVSNGVDVINMSIISGDYLEEYKMNALRGSIENAIDNNVVLVAGAGNDECDAQKFVPARFDEVITVSATERDNTPDKSYTCFGSCVDIAAPGTGIRSTVPKTVGEGDKEVTFPVPYLSLNGTSMSTPLVSAAAALLKSINPDITPAEVKRIIKETAYVPDTWAEENSENNYGTGIVNFLNMVKAEVTEAKPTITMKNGKIVITAPEGSDSRIYYSLDGTVPTIDNPLTYTEPLNIGGMNVRKITAVCHENGKLIGEPVTYETVRRIELDTLYFKHTTNPMPKDMSLKARWRSSNPDIASVDSKGTITGVSPGTTYVYAYRADGMKMIYKVTVEYALWQEILIYFFFGFLWYI